MGRRATVTLARRNISVIGIPPGGVEALGPAERELLAQADVLAGGRRQVAAVEAAGTAGSDGVAGPVGGAGGRGAGGHVIEITGDVSSALDAIEAAARSGSVVVVASGDPGFFGIGRALATRFGAEALDVRPAVSSVAAAFGRLGLPWDDALVVSAHGRELDAAVACLRGAAKVAVLASPENTPERIGAAGVAAGASFECAAVVSDLGLASERLEAGAGLEWLAGGTFSALSVVVLWNGGIAGLPAARWEGAPTLAEFGRDETEFEHRGGMITKAEVRSVVLGRLCLPGAGVLWDVGAGSGSVAIEASRLSPGLRVFAIEKAAEAVGTIHANAKRHEARIEVVLGEAPAALGGLPAPDRVFVGGGGLGVLDAALARMSPGGRMVATFAAVDRALGAADRLGNIAEMSVSRGVRLPDGALRLAALDPVFVCWGPW